MYAPLFSTNETAPTETAEVPPSIIIAAARKQPTRGEVAAAISELSSATGNVLRASDPSKLQTPVVIYERLDLHQPQIKPHHMLSPRHIASTASLPRGPTH